MGTMVDRETKVLRSTVDNLSNTHNGELGENHDKLYGTV